MSRQTLHSNFKQQKIMKTILNQLFTHKTLTKNEAYGILAKITNEEFSNEEIASFLSVFLMRSITLNELAGFRQALLDLRIPLNFSEFETIDLCGTGGDGKNTFNISTLTAFIVAGAGYKVAKHGNYGVSSRCGSSNLLEFLGYKFINNEEALKLQLEHANICFLHAPLFHPAMKTVAPIRRNLGIKTFFNILGPLVNPSNPAHQFSGVYNLELVRLYSYLLQSEKKSFGIVHALDGYDEISLTGDFKIISNAGEKIYSPEDLNFNPIHANEIAGGEGVEDSADIFLNILEGKGTKAQNNTVLANAAFAISIIEKNKTIDECLELAKKSLLDKAAFNTLKKLLAIK